MYEQNSAAFGEDVEQFCQIVPHDILLKKVLTIQLLDLLLLKRQEGSVMKEDLLQGKISAVLIRYAVPVILSMAATQFYSIADGMMVGTGLGSPALAAVSNAAVILQFFMFVSGGMELGGNLLIAAYRHRMNPEEMTETVYSLLALDLAVGMILTAAGQLLAGQLLEWIHTPDEIMSQSLLYVRIYLLGFPFLMEYDLMKQILMGSGDSGGPMRLVLLTTCLNIGLDALLIFVFPFGVGGAAAASALSQVVGMLLCYRMVFRAILKQRFAIRFLKLAPVKEMIRLSLPTVVQQMMGPVSNMVRQTRLGMIGVSAIAGFSAANSLSVFLLMPMAGCCQALVVFTAQNLSAGQQERTKEAVRVSRRLTAGITTLLILLCLCFHEQLLSFYTDDREALRYGTLLLTREPFFYYFYALRNINESRLRGFRKMKEYLFSSVLTTGLTAGFTWILTGWVGFHGFYLATGLGNLVGMVVSGRLVKKNVWRKVPAKMEETE